MKPRGIENNEGSEAKYSRKWQEKMAKRMSIGHRCMKDKLQETCYE